MNVNVIDDDIPVVVLCPGGQTVNPDATCQSVVSDYTMLFAANDNCDNSLTITQTPAPGTTMSGDATVTITATDDANNNVSCSFLINVTDIIAPTLSGCPTNHNENVNASCNFILPDYTLLVTASDNCSGVTLTQSPAAGSLFNGAGTTVPITITASDANGNTTDCSFTINLIDVINPTITCPANITVGVDAGNCTATVTSLGTPTSADNCFVDTVTNNHPSTTYPLGSTIVVWTVTDESGNTATCNQTVTVVDNISPALTCSANISSTVATGSCNASIATPNSTFNDNCSVSALTWVMTGATTGTSAATGINNVGTQTFNIGVTTITYTVKDAANNTITCSYTVTINDNISPTITCPANVTVNVASGCTATVTAATLGTLVTGDNCAVASVTNNHPSTTYPVGTTTVLWTVTDAAGNSNTCTQTVTVVDNINPTITCPANITVNATAGACNAIVNVPVPATADNCSVASVINSYNAGGANASGTYPVGTTTVTYTVTDANNNSATCSITVTVVDNQNPTITCPANITNSTDAGVCTANITVPAPVAADNCTVASVVNSFNGTNNASGVYPSGTTNVLWTVTDGVGNTATCTMTVTVNDDENPVITACAANVSINADAGSCSAIVTNAALGTPTANDNCLIASITNNHSSTTYPVGTTTIVWTVTDASGNSAICNQTVTVLDNSAPVINCPAEQTLDLGATCSASLPNYTPLATVNDNCTPSASIIVTQSPAAGTIVIGTGVTVITLTATDATGNADSCTFNVNLVDVTSPSIICGDEITAYALANQDSAYVDIITPDANDNCAIATIINNVTGTNDASANYPIGTTIIEWIATDLANNADTCYQTIIVLDATPPAIECYNVTLNSDSTICGTLVNLGQPIVQSNTAVTYWNDYTNSAQAPNEIFNVGTTYINWTVTDIYGNTASCTDSITVIDNVDPVIYCQDTLIASSQAGLCGAYIQVAIPDVFENCNGFNLINTQNDGTDASGVYPIGTTIITWIASDASFNFGFCEQVIIVEDAITTVINCPGDQQEALDINGEFILPNYTDTTFLTYTADCPLDFTQSPSAGSAITTDTLVTIYAAEYGIVTDSCSFMLLLNDIINPVIICPNDTTIASDINSCDATINNLGTPVYSDNSGFATITNNYTGTTFPIGTTLVTWTATDANGNTSSCVQNINVVDSQLPQIICPSDTILGTNVACSAWIDFELPMVSDNCSINTFYHDYQAAPSSSSSSALYDLGITNITWTVIDNANNTNTCIQQVTVQDVTAPTFNCYNDTIIYLSSGITSAQVNFPTLFPNDNCSVDIFTNDYNNSFNPSGVYNLGNTIVNWTITDDSGNTYNCEHNVLLVDATPPTIECSNVTLYSDSTNCGTLVNLGQPIVQSNTAVTYWNDYTNSSQAPNEIFNVGTTYINWTVTDIYGGTASCADTITVIDNINPVIYCQDTLIASSQAGLCGAYIQVAIPDVFENCSNSSLINTFTSGTDASGIYPLGITTISWIASDASFNFGFCEQVIIVEDAIITSLNCMGDQQEALDANGEFVLPNYSDSITYTADCPLTLTQSPSAGSVITTDTLITIYAAEYGIVTDSCTFILTVADTDAPQFTCPIDTITYYTNENCEFVIGNQTSLIDSATIVENAEYTIHQLPNADSITTNISEVLVWIEDEFGNVSDTCHIPVLVVDTIAPVVVSSPTEYQVYLNENCQYLVPDFSTIISTIDNCGNVYSIGQTPATNSIISEVGSTNASYTVEDESGNITTINFILSVADTTAPVIIFSNEIQLEVNNNCVAFIPDYSAAANYNDCSAATVTQSSSIGALSQGESTIITLTATDIYGNTSTQEVLVTAIDATAPTIMQLPDTTITLSFGVCDVAYEINNAGAADNCDNSPTIEIVDNPATYSPGIYTIEYYAVDDSGNSSDTLSFILEIIDNNAPVFIPLDNNYYTTCDINFDYPDMYAVICGGEVIMATDISAPLTLGNNTIQYLATAPNGISVIYTYTVNVIELPTVNWVVPATICYNAEPINLDATTTSEYTISIEINGTNTVLAGNTLNPLDYAVGSYTLILDVISDTCSADITNTINIISGPQFVIAEDSIATCTNEAGTLYNAANSDVTWNTPAEVVATYTNNEVTFSSNIYGSYLITAIADDNGCTSTDSIYVTFWEQPQVPYAGPDAELPLVGEFITQGEYSGVGTYTWNTISGNGNIADENELITVVTELETGNNIFTLVVSNGICTAADTVIINLNGLVIPTGFSPNNDGVNDNFEIAGIDMTEKALLEVYNRWGQLIYKSTKYTNDWNARNMQNELLPDDTYFYELTIDEYKYQGFVIIKR
jgi:gliding motility-associated-like protein